MIALDLDELKRKLRQLKKLELNIRSGEFSSERKIRLVWSEFFSTRDPYDPTVKYNLNLLASMDRQQIKEVFDRFFAEVYYRKYKENGITFSDLYSPELLSILGLPPGSGEADIKKRFRELAKIHHPDHGGSQDKMIELLEAYRKLLDRTGG